MRHSFMAALLLGLVASPAFSLEFYQSPFTLAQGAQGYYYNDQGTQVHEDTHGVNSLLRNQYGGECFFVGGTSFVRFQRFGGVSLSQLIATWQHRGLTFGTFSSGVTSWNDTPFYVFDEWIAYSNSAVVAHTIAGDHGSRIESSLECAYYCYQLLRLLPRSYPDRYNAIAFWTWNAERVLAAADRARATGLHYRRSQDGWREWVRAKLNGA